MIKLENTDCVYYETLHKCKILHTRECGRHCGFYETKEQLEKRLRKRKRQITKRHLKSIE